MNDDLSRHEAELDLSDPNLTSSLVADLVGQGTAVLVLGRGPDDLDAVLTSRDCKVTAVHADETGADGGSDGHDVMVADLVDQLPSALLAGRSFGAVVVADVLERASDPAALLADAATLLEPGGRLVVTAANVSHGSVRLALFEGRWYDDRAVRRLDRAGLLRLVGEAGLVVEELHGSLADPMATEVRVHAARLPASLVEWVRDQPDALVRTFVLAVAPASGADQAGVHSPALVTSVPETQVRLKDRYTEQAQADLEERHRVLTQRDHIIGLEAAAATAQYAAELVERKLRGATRRLNRKNARIKELAKQVKKLEDQLGGDLGSAEQPGWRRKLGRG